jgi:hypothetical protein
MCRQAANLIEAMLQKVYYIQISRRKIFVSNEQQQEEVYPRRNYQSLIPIYRYVCNALRRERGHGGGRY